MGMVNYCYTNIIDDVHSMMLAWFYFDESVNKSARQDEGCMWRINGGEYLL